MARLQARGILLGLMLISFCAPVFSGRHAGTALPSIRVRGNEYVLLEDFAARYDLKVTWIRKGMSVRLQKENTVIELAANSRKMIWNGLSIYLSEAPSTYRDTLALSLSDVHSTAEPLLQSHLLAERGKVRLIAIDPGHGGIDSGTQNSRFKFREKTLALDLALRLKVALERLGYRAILTRASDKYVGLEKRSAMARRAGADLLLSLHFNALRSNPDVHGIETYAFTPAGQRSTATGVHHPASEKSQMSNRYDQWNLVLAAFMQQNLVTDLGAVDHGVKRARFVVLRDLQCPGVLIEGGFLSNDAEAKKISTTLYREKIARAIARGVQSYVVALESTST